MHNADGNSILGHVDPTTLDNAPAQAADVEAWIDDMQDDACGACLSWPWLRAEVAHYR